MRTTFLLTVAAYAAVWWWAFMTLPDRVPLHFGLSGDVDDWGTRTEVLTASALVGAGTAALLGAGAWWVGRAPLDSPWVNLPAKRWWTASPERSERARRMVRRDLYVVSALTMALLTVVLAGVVRASQQSDPRLGPVTMALGLLIVVALLGYSTWLTVRRYRPDDGSGGAV